MAIFVVTVTTVFDILMRRPDECFFDSKISKRQHVCSFAGWSLHPLERFGLEGLPLRCLSVALPWTCAPRSASSKRRVPRLLACITAESRQVNVTYGDAVHGDTFETSDFFRGFSTEAGREVGSDVAEVAADLERGLRLAGCVDYALRDLALLLKNMHWRPKLHLLLALLTIWF